MIANNRGGTRSAVTVRAITGHATGVSLSAAQQQHAQVALNDPSTRQARVLSSTMPNTDRRRFVTHR